MTMQGKHTGLIYQHSTIKNVFSMPDIEQKFLAANFYIFLILANIEWSEKTEGKGLELLEFLEERNVISWPFISDQIRKIITDKRNQKI